MSAFAALGLRPEILDVLTTLGYEAPTPIQERTIPLLLSGRDLIGQAQTGTGKTAAFALPMLEKIDPKKKTTQALVLAPTRELAMQVAEAVHSYAAKLDHVSVIPVYGGAPIVPQLKRLERGAHIVVGTPGRLIDHLDRGSLDLSHIRFVVLDEADEMLKMGFIEDMERILGAMPAERQTALFSATMPEEVMRIAKRHLRNPERVEIEHKAINAPDIEQRFLNVSEGQKLEVLTQILELEPAQAVLVFRRTKTGSADLAEKLEARGFAAVAMHGDMTQSLREGVIRRLRAGQVEIVVATDVAARGLDVEQIEHVINYDVPYDVEAYVHRIGRTGRAGRSGVATMFITPRERRMMREIERFTGTSIKPMKMPTRADVAAKRVSVFKDNLRKVMTDGDLEMFVELVENLAEEGHDMADIAAAASKMAIGKRIDDVSSRREESEPGAAPAPFAEAAGRGAPRSPGSERTVRLSMAVGRREGIRPADIVGSIANEAGIPGRDIGPIDIQETITYVGIPEHSVDVVLEKVARKKFRGSPLNIRVASAGEEEIQKTFKPRKATTGARYGAEDRPKRPAGSSYGADDRPKRSASGPPYGAGERPKRPAGGPPYGAGERPKRPAGGPPYGAGERPKRAAGAAPYGAGPRRRPDDAPRRTDSDRGPRRPAPAGGGPKNPFDRFAKKGKKRY
jgi:ATP-dependent RNA helicase DeaD